MSSEPALRLGKPAVVTSLVHSDQLNGRVPHAYLKDVLERLRTRAASRVQELLPNRWQPTPAKTFSN